ncbi:MAG: hypothetical protein ACLP1X_30970 [Polyangiaceae bacterium]
MATLKNTNAAHIRAVVHAQLSRSDDRKMFEAAAKDASPDALVALAARTIVQARLSASPRSHPPGSSRSDTRRSTAPSAAPVVPPVHGRAGNRTSEVKIVSAGPELEETALDSVWEVLDGNAVPILVASPEELMRLRLPQGEARVLAHIDGVSSLDAVCAKAKVSPEDGALILLELRRRPRFMERFAPISTLSRPRS